MWNQQNPRDQKPTRCSAYLRCMRVVSIALLLLPTARPHAQTIYRCGDEYSTSAICAGGRSALISTPSESHTPAHDKTSSVTQDLREAEALEKIRLRSESRVVQNAPAQMMSTFQNTPAGSTDASAADIRHSNRYTRRLQSPYFTAKDPNAPPKKKGIAKTLPPVAN